MSTDTSARSLKGLLVIPWILAMSVLSGTVPAHGDTLKVMTINVWSGLDYKGVLRSGEYETPEARERRFGSLVRQVKELSPAIIFVQEANPVGRYARKLASALDMDEVHQVVNAGIKIGSFGIPVNLKEGLVILARRGLALKKKDAWKLSGAWGIHTDPVSFHLTEVVLVLVAGVTVNQLDITLINVHLAASPPMPGDLSGFKEKIRTAYDMTDEQFDMAVRTWRQREGRRYEEMGKLLGHIEALRAGTQLIIAGDFNDGPGSRVMRTFRESGNFTNTLTVVTQEDAFTWDPARNANIGFTTGVVDARGKPREGYELLTALADDRCRRLDYIFLSDTFPGIKTGVDEIVLTTGKDGRPPSDHFGVAVDIQVAK